MNKKLFFRLCIDFSMFILFLLLMAYPLSFHYLHEIFGVVFALFLGLHTGLNWWWYKNLNKGKYNLIRKCHTAVNLLLIALILVNIISALGISQWLFLFLPIDWGLTGRNLHVLSAYWGMILLAMHIGFHWDMLMSIMRKTLNLSSPHIYRTYLLRILTFLIVFYGFLATVKLEIGARLVAYYSFFFLDPEQSYFMLLIDYLAFCGLCIAITHYGIKFLRKLHKINTNQNNIKI
ncbi:hypothetical protein [Gilliamella sp. wkB108]|uniref:hypothetical protein n=1 Tax=Gilliamella sp. wkB108 TaxID=3120256 RepID=UPI0009BD5E11|nr:hypothetical protein [Gilliamella apicola]